MDSKVSEVEEMNEKSSLKMRILKWMKFVIPVLGFLFWKLSLGIYDYWYAKKKVAEKKPPIVKILTIQKESYAPILENSGILESSSIRNLHFKLTGRVEKLFLKTGENVSKGAALAKLETFALELEKEKQNAALETAMASVELSREKYHKARRAFQGRKHDQKKQEISLRKAKEELIKTEGNFLAKNLIYQKGGVSKEELELTRLEILNKELNLANSEKEFELSLIGLKDIDLKEAGVPIPENPEDKWEALRLLNTATEKAEWKAAESQLKSLQYTIRSIEMNLEECILRSPISGVVLEVNKREGELITDSSPVIKIANLDELKFIFYMNEKETVPLSLGMEVKIYSDNYPKKVFSARISMISPIVDTKSHTVMLEAILDNRQGLLRPGSFVRGKIFLKERTSRILVPRTAIVKQENNNAKLFILNSENVLFLKEVIIESNEEESFLIYSGLKEGERIVKENWQNLSEGMLVRIEK